MRGQTQLFADSAQFFFKTEIFAARHGFLFSPSIGRVLKD